MMRVDDGEPRAHGEVEVEQHVGEVLAPLRLDVQVRLGEPGDDAVGELDAAGEAHQLVGLEDADLDDGVGVDERLADGERRGTACPRARRAPPRSSSTSTIWTPSAAHTSAMPLSL